MDKRITDRMNKACVDAITWFEMQTCWNRRLLRFTTLVPNSDSPVFFVEEMIGPHAEWQEIGDGFSILEAIEKAKEHDKTRV